MQKQQKWFEVTFDDKLNHILSFARRCGHLQGGLERIQTTLQNEEAGLMLIDPNRKNKNPAKKITRLLIISNDGSDRFYRECARLLTLYEHCLLVLKLDVSSQTLGNSFFGKDKAVKAILVTRRETASKILSTINISNDEKQE
jgi:hypothetical protein